METERPVLSLLWRFQTVVDRKMSRLNFKKKEENEKMNTLVTQHFIIACLLVRPTEREVGGINNGRVHLMLMTMHDQYLTNVNTSRSRTLTTSKLRS